MRRKKKGKLLQIFGEPREQIGHPASKFWVSIMKAMFANEMLNDRLDQLWIEINKKLVVTNQILKILKLDYSVWILNKVALNC